MIDVAGRAARAHSHRPVLGVNPHPPHRRQVDDQAVIDAAQTGTIVPAAANGDGELVAPPEIHRRDDIGDVGASGDEQWPLVDHGVVEFTRLPYSGWLRPISPPRRLWPNLAMSSSFMGLV